MNGSERPGGDGGGWNPDDYSVTPLPQRSSTPGDSEAAEHREPEPAIDVQLNEPEPTGGKKLRRSLFAAGVVGLVAMVTTFYMAAVPAVPASAASAETEAPADEEERVVEQRSRSASAPAPRPRGSGAGRIARDYYLPSGDLVDLFCRPRGEETIEAWRGRVAGHCQDRAR